MKLRDLSENFAFLTSYWMAIDNTKSARNSEKMTAEKFSSLHFVRIKSCQQNL